MKIITVTQQKGGTGKTTTAAAIGAGLIRMGQRVLYVDLDPQGNLSYIMGATGNIKTACELFNGTPAKDVLYQLASDKLPGFEGNGAIIPASAFLSGADATITGKGREHRLAQALAPLKNLFDYCIIDTPPALGILTVNALTAADSVIIPSLADIFSIQATGQIAQTINGIRASSNPQLKIAGILLTRYTARQNLTKDIVEVLEDAAEQIGTRLFHTRIRESVSIRESQAMGQDVFSYNPHSNGAKDYQSLIGEIF